MPGHLGSIRILSLKVEVGAGTYYIGDPGYAFAPEEWEEWEGFLEEREGFPGAMMTHVVDGWGAVVFFTLIGDGLYLDQHSNPYNVDSGLIGVFPVERVSSSVDREKMARLGQFCHFESSFLVKYDGEQGIVWFGDIEIDLGQTYIEV